MRRVVVTGLGAVTPLGTGKHPRSYIPHPRFRALTGSAGTRHTWKRLLEGHCGIVSVKDKHPGFVELPCQIAAVVPRGSKETGGWNASEWVTRDVNSSLHGGF